MILAWRIGFPLKRGPQAFSLSEGQVVRLRHFESDLSQVTMGLGWDVLASKRESFGTLFGPKPRTPNWRS